MEYFRQWANACCWVCERIVAPLYMRSCVYIGLRAMQRARRGTNHGAYTCDDDCNESCEYVVMIARRIRMGAERVMG